MGKEINMLGKKFGRLLVIKRTSPSKKKYIRWDCVCDCGNERKVIGASLRSGHAQSCGCLQREISSAQQMKHGLSRNPLHCAWKDMKRRCYNEECESFRWYGAKGIKICDEWLESAERFMAWALANGWEKGLTIDRIDSSGDYEPDNCQFLTRSENSLKRHHIQQ